MNARSPWPQGGPFKRNIPNALTILSLCSGLTSLRMTLTDRVEPAIYFILIAIVLDGLDGRAARHLNAESHFGAELDSLADFLCFGIAPGMLVYTFMFHGTDMSGLGWVACMLLVVCCMLRLARFNVSGAELADSGQPVFTGVPAPAIAFLALMPIYLLQCGFTATQFFHYIFVFYLAGVSYLAVSRIPTFSPKMVSIQTAGSRVIAVLGLVALLLMMSVTWYAFVLLAAVYLLSIPFLARHFR
ncbi:CDP-diacylglycerol--serine O-phosphatidyltransferase [Falsiruegeria mediterranea]|jgi:CDP-diacylglycerol---serine O-phosphatidyltransferase|uniref:CDP-diacylglycerol--serine O-phosphatidyltransferase n=1 Tax=Falsiruegeria mediterranea M17 TaxID=1200281 RepID=A0A2R8C7T5_9RHOB|nr:CDP-diacylglycerol--serine O-phosphatidyltransferase [Falsiruegeria mediterranea]SPJ28499.1 hypothetical protein TRM7615_01998 [Falsiruegeria mediterranea M17]